MKKMMVLVLGVVAWAVFGEAYDPAKHGNPIVVTSGTIDIDGNGAVIDGEGKERCATLGPNVTIRNFVLKNGMAELGGGVYGGKVVDCEITGCQATESAAALCNAVAENCTISGNVFNNGSSTAAAHGGLFFGATLTGCTVSGNTVTFGSEAPAFGGIGERVTMKDCTVKDNTVSAGELICYGKLYAYSTIDGADVVFEDGAEPSPGPTPPDPPDPPDPPTPDDPQPDPSSYTSESDPVFDIGEGMVNRYFEPVYLDLLGDFDRSYDKKTTVKAEGLPKGLKLVKTKVGDMYDYKIEGVPTEPLDGVTRIAYMRIMDSQKKVSYGPLSKLRIFPATVAVFPPATNRVEYWRFPVSKIWPGYEGNEKSWTFSGWPSGIRFASRETIYNGHEIASGRVYGKPTKVGTFTVKAVEKIAGTSYKNTHLATFVVRYEDGREPPATDKHVPAAVVELPTDMHETVETVKDIRLGVGYEWPLTNTLYSTVSAKGLPSGLKLASSNVLDKVTRKRTYFYRVTGVPTKTGYFFSTFTVKLNGVSSVSTVAFNVEGLPTWAQGTFDGGVGASEISPGGQVTLTVSKAGKLNGKWLSLGTNWTLTATSYARYDRENDCYYADVLRKTGSGKNAVSFTEELRVSPTTLGGLAVCDLFQAYQNNWKTKTWMTAGSAFSKAKELVFVPDGYETNDTISLKFAASGKVTVKGKFVKSVSDKGNITWYSVSGSAVLCPQTELGKANAFGGYVFVYLPPKAKTPLSEGGYAVCVPVIWDGTKFDIWKQDDE